MISSCVSVPVLSVHITSIAPKFWMALSPYTPPCAAPTRRHPWARLDETIIGSISGVRPTATARAKRNASIQSPLVRPLIRKTTGRHHQHEADQQPADAVDAAVERRLRPRSRRSPSRGTEIGVRTGRHDDGGGRSETTFVPMKQMLGRSSSPVCSPAAAPADFLATAPSVSYFLSTGSASPVNAAWLTNNRSRDSTSGCRRGSCRQPTVNDVARDDLRHRDLADFGSPTGSRAAYHGRRGPHHRLQRVGGLAGPVFCQKRRIALSITMVRMIVTVV